MSRMTRFGLGGVMVLVAVGLSGCGSGDNSNPNLNPAPASPSLLGTLEICPQVESLLQSQVPAAPTAENLRNVESELNSLAAKANFEYESLLRNLAGAAGEWAATPTGTSGNAAKAKFDAGRKALDDKCTELTDRGPSEGGNRDADVG